MADRVTLPKHPSNRKQFERGLIWASEFFGVAQHIDVGLDEGQQATLAAAVKRLDSLEIELWAQQHGEGEA